MRNLPCWSFFNTHLGSRTCTCLTTKHSHASSEDCVINSVCQHNLNVNISFTFCYVHLIIYWDFNYLDDKTSKSVFQVSLLSFHWTLLHYKLNFINSKIRHRIIKQPLSAVCLNVRKQAFKCTLREYHPSHLQPRCYSLTDRSGVWAPLAVVRAKRVWNVQILTVIYRIEIICRFKEQVFKKKEKNHTTIIIATKGLVIRYLYLVSNISLANFWKFSALRSEISPNGT